MYRKGGIVMNNMSENFIKDFKLEGGSAFLRLCCKEMLHICLVELRRIEKNESLRDENLDLSSLAFGDFSTSLERRVLDLAGYWSNDLEFAVIDECVESCKESPFAISIGEGFTVERVNCFDLIYKWLYEKYNLSF